MTGQVYCKMILKCDFSAAFLLVSLGFWVWGAGPQRESTISPIISHQGCIPGELSMVDTDVILDLYFVSQKGQGALF